MRELRASEEKAMGDPATRMGPRARCAVPGLRKVDACQLGIEWPEEGFIRTANSTRQRRSMPAAWS
jgi:hypothetical protein